MTAAIESDENKVTVKMFVKKEKKMFEVFFMSEQARDRVMWDICRFGQRWHE